MISTSDITTQSSLLDQVVAVQLSSTFIGYADGPDDTRLNFGYWKGHITEICCRKVHDQWVPFAINYHEKNSVQAIQLRQNLSNTQLERLYQAMLADESM